MLEHFLRSRFPGGRALGASCAVSRGPPGPRRARRRGRAAQVAARACKCLVCILGVRRAYLYRLFRSPRRRGAVPASMSGDFSDRRGAGARDDPGGGRRRARARGRDGKWARPALHPPPPATTPERGGEGRGEGAGQDSRRHTAGFGLSKVYFGGGQTYQTRRRDRPDDRLDAPTFLQFDPRRGGGTPPTYARKSPHGRATPRPRIRKCTKTSVD